MSDGLLGNSFRDPSGFVYRKNGVIYRQINHCYRPVWEKFVSSGLCQELIESGLLVDHKIAQEVDFLTDDGWLTIEPEPVEFWSYPYEWCFSQLKDAALVTLSIQKKALRRGMSMKDSSAYNVQFVKGVPVLIDSLSFENYDPSSGWKGFRQFCMHFLAPLTLMSRRDPRLGQLTRVHFEGVPLGLASSLLPTKSWLNFSTLLYIHLHAKTEKRYAKKTHSSKGQHVIHSDKVESLLDSLESAIQKLSIGLSSQWMNYYDSIHYGQEALLHKEEIVTGYMEMVSPNTVWDLGANTGSFSRIAARRANLVASFDFDFAAVESNYRSCKSSSRRNILPLWLDLTNPSPRMGWANGETMNLADRGTVDLILLLALIHHLAIANNIPLDRIAEFLAPLATNLIIEFVPKSDPMVQKLLSHREDIFTQYDERTFEYLFSKYFEIVGSEKILGTDRTVYLMKSKLARHGSLPCSGVSRSALHACQAE